MSIKAISFMSTPAKTQQSVSKTATAPTAGAPEPAKKKGKGKLVAFLAAAGAAGLAIVAIKKNKAKKIAEVVEAPVNSVREAMNNRLANLGDMGKESLGKAEISDLLRRERSARDFDVIDQVAERTSEQGVNKWLNLLGEGAEHVAQKASIID